MLASLARSDEKDPTFSVTAEIFQSSSCLQRNATAPSALTRAAFFNRSYFRYPL